jgi:hypothetical protein
MSSSSAGIRGVWNGPVATTTWPAVSAQAVDAAPELHRQVAGVLGEVADNLVARRVVVRVARERPARQAVVARRGEQPQRVPALAPGGGRPVRGLEDREVATLLGQVVAGGEAGLSAADDDDLAVGCAHGIGTSVTAVAVVRAAT